MLSFLARSDLEFSETCRALARLRNQLRLEPVSADFGREYLIESQYLSAQARHCAGFRLVGDNLLAADHSQINRLLPVFIQVVDNEDLDLPLGRASDLLVPEIDHNSDRREGVANAILEIRLELELFKIDEVVARCSALGPGLIAGPRIGQPTE